MVMKSRLLATKIDFKKHSMLIALVAIAVLFQILTNGVIFKPMNLSNLIMQNSYILILAIGMLPCIITGNVDLSVGSVLALISAICGELIVVMKLPVGTSILIALAVGILIGAWQGFWIAYVRVPAFIVTLAGMLIFRGLTMVVLEGRTLSPFPKEYSWIAAGFLPQARFGKFDLVAIGFGLLCVVLLLYYQIKERLNAIKYEEKVENKYFFAFKLLVISFTIVFLTYWLGTHNGLPSIFILLVLLVLIYTFVTRKTVIGRRVYAFGGNEKAAKLSGINTNRVLFLTFVNMGLVAAIAGIVFSGRLNAATPNAGVGFELDAIAACYIGGASATGGTGKIIGAVIGGLVMGILNNGMSIMGVGVDWQQAIKGLVLLLAVAIDIMSREKTSVIVINVPHHSCLKSTPRNFRWITAKRRPILWLNCD